MTGSFKQRFGTIQGALAQAGNPGRGGGVDGPWEA
jgi:hypothetical protein